MEESQMAETESGQGDDPAHIRHWVGLLAGNGCLLIFCTCRDEESNFQAIKDIAQQHGYTLITTAPYTMEIPTSSSADEKPLNVKKAEHLETFV